MSRRTIMVILSALFITLATVGCPTDGNPTKLDLCYKLAKAYCQQGLKLSCFNYEECLGDNYDSCDSIFDASCGATDEWVEQIDHDITMWIKTKENCSSLESLSSDLQAEISNLQSAACQSSSSTKTMGNLCSGVLETMCKKMVAMDCVDISTSACVSQLFTGQVVILGGYTCHSADDDSAATSASTQDAEAWKLASKAADSCEDFGF